MIDILPDLILSKPTGELETLLASLYKVLMQSLIFP